MIMDSSSTHKRHRPLESEEEPGGSREDRYSEMEKNLIDMARMAQHMASQRIASAQNDSLARNSFIDPALSSEMRSIRAATIDL
jgi:hypothetical protein